MERWIDRFSWPDGMGDVLVLSPWNPHVWQVNIEKLKTFSGQAKPNQSVLNIVPSRYTSAPRMPKTYEANCHCGSIRYTVTLPEALSPEGPGQIGKCNCSICTKNGYLLVYPKREDVVFLDNSETRLQNYFFGKKLKPHRFCSECGSSVLIDFANSDIERQRDFLAMNTRLFKDIDLDRAEYSTFDGRSKLDPPYEG